MNELVNVDEHQISMYDKIQDPIAAIAKMGAFFMESHMFGCKSVEQGMVIAMACICDKMTPFDVMRKFHLIDGKLSMKAEAMLAGFRERGGTYVWEQFDDKAAVASFTIEGKTTKISYTIEDARKAGLNSPNWRCRPDAMLRSKLSSKAVRMLTPEVNTGVYTPEEIEDFAQPSLPYAPAPLKQATIAPQEPAPISMTQGGIEKKRRFPAPSDPAPEAPLKTVKAPAPIAKIKEPEEAPIEPEPEATAPDGQLNEEQDVVKQIAGDKLPSVIQWMKKNGWITGDDLSTLQPDKCERILARPDPFLRAVALDKAPS